MEEAQAQALALEDTVLKVPLGVMVQDRVATERIWLADEISEWIRWVP
jgi:hypothetical protein